MYRSTAIRLRNHIYENILKWRVAPNLEPLSVVSLVGEDKSDLKWFTYRPQSQSVTPTTTRSPIQVGISFPEYQPLEDVENANITITIPGADTTEIRSVRDYILKNLPRTGPSSHVDSDEIVALPGFHIQAKDHKAKAERHSEIPVPGSPIATERGVKGVLGPFIQIKDGKRDQHVYAVVAHHVVSNYGREPTHNPHTPTNVLWFDRSKQRPRIGRVDELSPRFEAKGYAKQVVQRGSVRIPVEQHSLSLGDWAIIRIDPAYEKTIKNTFPARFFHQCIPEGGTYPLFDECKIATGVSGPSIATRIVVDDVIIDWPTKEKDTILPLLFRQQSMYTCDTIIAKGDCGAPFVATDGNVRGIVTGRHVARHEGFEHIAAATPLRAILKQIIDKTDCQRIGILNEPV